MFNEGIMDALTVAEEIYLCDIVGGEPVIEKIKSCKSYYFWGILTLKREGC